VNGGGDTVNFVSGSGNAVTVSDTDNNWDSVNGSSGTIYLTSGQAQVNGGGDTVNFVSGSGNAVTVANTDNSWDSVNGSSGTVYLTSGQAAVTGGGNTIDFTGGSGNAVSVYATNGAWDAVNGSNGSVYLFNTQAGVAGNDDTTYRNGDNSTTVNGANEAFVFQPTIGEDTINGFTSTDSMQFSTSDFANWAVLQSHISQSGANAVITLDVTDKVTLTDVMTSSLSGSQFHFT